MTLSTLGDVDVAARVESTIYRRSAGGGVAAHANAVLAAAGGGLAVVAMFVTWYSAARTANAWYSGWMPVPGLVLIAAAACLVVGKHLGVIDGETRMPAERFMYGLFAGAALLMMARHLFHGDLHDAIYLMALPIVAWGMFLRFDRVVSHLEVEQVALVLATVGGAVVILKRILDARNATGGWAWGLLAAAAVAIAAFVAARGLGVLSGFQVALFSTLAISTIVLIVLIAQVVSDGWPVLAERLGDFWSGTLRSRSADDKLGIAQGVVGSFWIAIFVAFLAFPVGIAAAVYLEEYAPRQVDPNESDPLRRTLNFISVRLTSVLDIMVRNLAGVPSVVYGLLGLFLFVKGNVVTNFGIDRINDMWGWFFDGEALIERGQSSLFAGGVTLAILVLPIVIITAAEAVRAVPQGLREGAYGVGATKWEVIKSQVLPFAAPGILTGTLLSLARAVGEAAPLILVGAITGRLAPRDSMFSGLDAFFGQFADRFTAMPIVIVGWVQNSGRDAGFGPAAGAAIVMLLVFVIAMNSAAVLLRNRFEKKRA